MSIKTLNDLFFHAARTLGSSKTFQRKVGDSYQPISAADFEKKSLQTAAALQEIGLKPGERAALLSTNRFEWAVADFGILLSAGINVPVYPTLTAEQVLYIIQDSGSRFVFVEDEEQLAKILQIRHNLPELKEVILIDGESSEPGVMTIGSLLDLGASRLDDRLAAIEDLAGSVKESDLCSFIYTSGTTGNPKGVMLTHGNIVSNIIACENYFETGSEDSCLSFLPLSHIFERMAGYYFMLYRGISIAYAESIDTVADNLREVSPTIMVSVPRLYEKMYAKILDTALSGSPVKKRIFIWAKQTGERWAEMTIAGEEIPFSLQFKYNLAVKLVFSKLKVKTGGRLRFFISGGAPLMADIAKFFYAAGLPIFEGYGLTETSPVIAANNFDIFRLGTVGKPMPGVEVRIAEDGEILTRGPNVMKGYFNNQAATEEVLDADGWFATGDIGEFDADGFLRITDRKKDLIVTAGGKNIAPQPIENKFKGDKFISECILIGDRRPFVSALLVPNFENLEQELEALGLAGKELSAVVGDDKVLAFYRKRIADLNSSLASYEQVREIRILDHELSLEEGELTPTMKVKRNKIEKKYSDLIESIYSS